MKGRRRPGPARGGRSRPAVASPDPVAITSEPRAARPPRLRLPAPVPRPAAVACLIVTAACVLISVTFRMDDPDVWQHLLVGKAIWRLGGVPHTHLWTWPLYGTPDVLPSWGFRALLWPFWAIGAVPGLYAWRWITTLVAFAAMREAARRMGVRGIATLPVLVLCALAYRARSQVRPETLVAVLLALEILVLESYRRAPQWRRLLPLVPIAIVWANAHVTYYLGLLLIVFHAIDAAWSTRGARRSIGADPAPSPLALAWMAAACVIVSFLNPFGWRALWQPFQFYLFERHEPIFQTIVELHPLQWGAHLRSGLPLVLIGWPLLAAWRARRHGVDVAESLTLILFTWLALSTQRFAGLYALVAAPYLTRDLDGWMLARAWPRWTAAPWTRATLVIAASLGIGIPEWTRAEYPIGLGFDRTQYPIAACDFVRDEIRGRGFNPYYFGGYQLWRFWPDRGRLPFMDIHQSGTRDDRALYAYAFAEPLAWRELDARRHFDYALLDGRPVPGDRLLETLGADSAWALVFRDDAAAVFVRRAGPLRAVAARHAYRLLPAGDAGVPELVRRDLDPAQRAGVRAEIQRQIAASPYHARALSLLATLEWVEGDRASARAHLIDALRVDPGAPGTRQRLGMLALAEGKWDEAVARLEGERTLGGAEGLDVLLGQAYARAGNPGRARAAYRRELKRNPSNAAARDSLAALEAAGR